jgi:hypothetical protein
MIMTVKEITADDAGHRHAEMTRDDLCVDFAMLPDERQRRLERVAGGFAETHRCAGIKDPTTAIDGQIRMACVQFDRECKMHGAG